MSAAVAAAVARRLGLRPAEPRPAGAGAWRIGREAFVKVLPSSGAPRLAAEAEGLAALATALRVPRVLGRGEADDFAWLALEWLELRPASDDAAAAFGRALAGLHRRSADAFGWEHDNWIGAAPQCNGWIRDWPRFFAERRLRPQFERAAERGAGSLAEDGRRLCRRLPDLLAGHDPAPSLIHGDLWGGNWGALADGSPAAFDPAVHYADRECDLAMTELFGGFPPAFYRAYEESWPLPPGAASRGPVYRLYHVLNHYNLFGGAWLGSARDLTGRLLGLR